MLKPNKMLLCVKIFYKKKPIEIIFLFTFKVTIIIFIVPFLVLKACMVTSWPVIVKLMMDYSKNSHISSLYSFLNLIATLVLMIAPYYTNFMYQI